MQRSPASVSALGFNALLKCAVALKFEQDGDSWTYP